MDREHRGVLFLAPEAAPRLGLDDDRLAGVERHGPLERRVHVVRALERPVDGHTAVVARDGNHRLGLDVQLFLVSDAIGPLDDEVGRRKAGREVALGDLVVREHMIGGERVEDRRQRFRPQADMLTRGAGCLGVGRGDERDRLCDVTDLVGDQGRLVVGHQGDDVLAGDVGGGDEHHARPIERGIALDRQQSGVGLRRADRHAVPGTGEDEVVGVHRPAREFLRPFAATDRAAPAYAWGSDGRAVVGQTGRWTRRVASVVIGGPW